MDNINVTTFNKHSKLLCFILLSHSSIYPLLANAATANITNGTGQLTGPYELNTAAQNQAAVKISGANTVVTGGDDVSIFINGPSSAVSLTNGSLTLAGSSITGNNISNSTSNMVTNTNGNLTLSDVDLSTDTIRAGGIQANGANSVTTISNSRLKGGYSTLVGQNGATLSVNDSLIESIGNYGIILANKSNLTGANNVINMDGDVYSWSAIHVASNIADSISTLTLDNTTIYVKHGKSGVEANRGGHITMTGIDLTGNVNVAVRSTQSGNVNIKNGSITLDEGAIAMAEGTSATETATLTLTNINAESSGIQNSYESNNQNFALINGKAFSNIVVNGGSFHSKGAEQLGVWAMKDSSTISLLNTSVITDTDKSIAIKSNGDILVKNSLVSTKGNYANGLFSEDKIIAENVDITTIGNNASAIFSDKAGHVGISNSTVNTTGDNSSVLEARNDSSIDTDRLKATTTGDSSHAILATRTAYIDEQSQISVSDSSFTTSGNNAAGIAVINQYFTPSQPTQYTSEITLSNSSITSNNGDGLYARGTDANVNLTNGSSLISSNGRLIYAETLDFGAGRYIPAHVSLAADGNSNLVGSVDFDAQSTVDMQLTRANWKMLSSSKVSNLSNLSHSVIDLSSNTNQYNTLTVVGDYVGDSTKDRAKNGRLIVNTVWNNDDSFSDLLNITGTATGYTQVQTKNGIIGNVTRGDDEQYSADVINVANHQMGANLFYGFTDTTGAGQAILMQKDSNTYAWYLPQYSPTPEFPPTTLDPIKPEAPGFTLMPRANMEIGYNIIGTLHERSSEQQTMAWDDCSQCQASHHDGQLWGKMLGKLEQVDAENRYGYRSKMWGTQFGYDFDINYSAEDRSRRHSGIMLTYVKDRLKFNDRRAVFFDMTSGNYAEQNQRTGTGQTDTVALGAYTTYYNKHGSYLDLVGNIDYSYNKYRSSRGSQSSNNAYGIELSTEVGRPYALFGSQWLIEPQAQLIYQYRTFSDFKTEHNVDVDQQDKHGLRGRVGFRLAYNKGTPELKTNTVYLVGNLVHDFIDSGRATKMGTDPIKDKTPRSFGEAGAGLQLPVSKTAYMYIDGRYSHSLNNANGKESAVRGNIGFKYHW